VQSTSWADGLELIGDDQRLVGHVGAVPLRLLAERIGLTAGVSAAVRRRGVDPVYDWGQVLVDLALVLILDPGRGDRREPARVPPPPRPPSGQRREAAPKLLRFSSAAPARAAGRGQRKRWLLLRADWSWTADPISAWHAVKAIPAPT
jgi:hypothetical protein